MMESVVDKVASKVGERFLIILLFPSFVFFASVAALAVTHFGWSQTLAWWDTLDHSRQALVVVAAVGALLLATTLLDISVRPLVRLFEGYWGHGAVALACTRAAVRLQARRLERLETREDDAAYNERYYTFPAPGVPPRGLATRFEPPSHTRPTLNAMGWTVCSFGPGCSRSYPKHCVPP
jgi:hypothetical protein